MTLTDREYQTLRDLGIAVLREVGVDTGGCNIQFAVNPADGRLVVIEMNPRVSRSSALASKATGFPIAKIAAKLAIGYTLDEIPNDITRKTPAAFEPALDYVVVKIPRFAFEKFPGADPELTTTMKSVGEAMSLGRNFAEALSKAMRSMETKARRVLDRPGPAGRRWTSTLGRAAGAARRPALHRRAGAAAGRDGRRGARGVRRIDPWFLDQIAGAGRRCAPRSLDAPVLDAGAAAPRQAGRPVRPAARRAAPGARRRGRRPRRCGTGSGVRPVYKTVDTCAAEFAANTPYHYSSYDEETEVAPSDRPKVLILGSGPNRIGQGIEFDYSCVHAVMALRAAGYETVMVNCNPETVSTDYDTADRLYFEPLTFEDVLEVVHAEDSRQAAGGPGVVGVIVQLGGQTPLGLAQRLKDAGVPIVGTSPESIHLAEDRGAFGALLAEAGLPAPEHGTATSFDEAKAIADEIGYPVLVRPSYVLGGRGMEIVYDDADAARLHRPGHRDLARTTRCWSTGSSTTPSRSTSTRSATPPARCTSAASWSTSRRPASTPATRPARCRRSRSARPTPGRGAPLHRGDRARRRRARAAQRPVRARRTTCSTCWRPTRARRGRCRSSRRRPRCRWPRRRPGSCSARPIAELRAEGMLPATGDGGDLPADAPIAVKEAVMPFNRFRTPAARASTRCSARR